MVKTALKDRRGFVEMLVKQGHSLKTFSEVCGVSYSSLQHVTSGARNPTPTVAFKICKAVGMAFDDLFIFVHFDRGVTDDGGKTEA